MPIVFYLERANQLSLLPDKDLVDLCPPIEPYQVTKNQQIFNQKPKPCISKTFCHSQLSGYVEVRAIAL
ncbi:hypothetical protein [Microcystis viridis]|uniref:hypothetical protein n=1 Tax=Microcystis viridis TaxID=44822 RepID=UPI0013DE782B|nr:hypothetical protein [Microcystis viridis]